jgi:hypothetical protein
MVTGALSDTAILEFSTQQMQPPMLAVGFKELRKIGWSWN